MDGKSQNRKSLNGLTNISADDISVDTLDVDTININNIKLNNGVANKFVKTDSNKRLVTINDDPVLTSGNQTVGGTKTFSSTIQGDISGNAGSVTNGVYTDDVRLTKISTTSTADQFTFDFNLSSTNKTYQTYNFQGNNNYIAVFDINQSMIFSDFAMVSGKKFLYPTGTANQFLKLDSSQFMVSQTLSTTDLTDGSELVKNVGDEEIAGDKTFTDKIKLKHNNTNFEIYNNNNNLYIKQGSNFRFRIKTDGSFEFYSNDIDTDGTITCNRLVVGGELRSNTGTIDCDNDHITTTGNVSGAVITASTNFAGNLTGNVTGNVTGNLTGDVTGNADTATLANKATKLNTNSNGIVKTTSSDGTLSIGGLVSGDIPNNSADTTGNAGTATALETARTIAGQSFNGTANIDIASTNLSDASSLVKTTGNQNIFGTKTFASPIVGHLNGEANTATQLHTARTIAGVSFNGSANIDIPSSGLSDGNNISLLDGVQTNTGKKTFSGGIEVNDINGTSGNTVGFGGNINTPKVITEDLECRDIDTASNANLLIKRNSTTIAQVTTSGVEVLSGTFVGNLTGNADTVTNGIINTGNQSIDGTLTTKGLAINPDSGYAYITSNDGIHFRANGSSNNIMLLRSTSIFLYQPITVSGTYLTTEIIRTPSSSNFKIKNNAGSFTHYEIDNTTGVITQTVGTSSTNKYFKMGMVTSGDLYSTLANRVFLETESQLIFGDTASNLNDIWAGHAFLEGLDVRKLDGVPYIYFTNQNNYIYRISGGTSSNDFIISKYNDPDSGEGSCEFFVYDESLALLQLKLGKGSDETNFTFGVATAGTHTGKQYLKTDNTELLLGDSASNLKNLISGSITSSGGLFATQTTGDGIRVKERGSGSDEIPVMFGFSPGLDFTETDTMAMCVGSSTASRRFHVRNGGIGGAFVKISNSEGAYAWATDNNEFYVFSYSGTNTGIVFKIDSSKNFNFYNGSLTTTSSITAGSLVTSSITSSTGTIDMGDDNITTTGDVTCDDVTCDNLKPNNIINTQSNATNVTIERFKGGMYSHPVWTPTNPFIPSGPGSYGSNFRLMIRPNDFLSDDDGTSVNRVVIQDLTSQSYSYGGTYFPSTTAQELFIYKEIPHRAKLVALKIVTVHKTTQSGGASAQALEVDIFSVRIIYPSEIKESVLLSSTPSTKHTNEVISFTSSSDENARTEGQYNQNPVVIIGLDNAGNQGVYKGGYLEFESV